MKRFVVVFLLLSFVLVPGKRLSAQGAGELLHAEYGAGNNWIDVTQRVGSMLRNNNAHFQVQSATFSTDPAVGEKKTFRLVTREADGHIQHLEFTDKQNIRLQGYKFDDTTQGLRILGAEYGAGSQLADVTSQVNASLKGGQLTMQATSDTLGKDPAPKEPKLLTVWFMVNGVPAQAVVKENDVLRLVARDRQ
jgi:hypothetical protein